MCCCSPVVLPVLRPSHCAVLLPKLLKPSQHEEYFGRLSGSPRAQGRQCAQSKGKTPGWTHARLGFLPSSLQGRCLCLSPKYRHKTPVGARQSHPRSPNRPFRKAHDNAQIQAVAGWNWASLILATKTQYFGVANNKKVFSSKLYSSVC